MARKNHGFWNCWVPKGKCVFLNHKAGNEVTFQESRLQEHLRALNIPLGFAPKSVHWPAGLFSAQDSGFISITEDSSGPPYHCENKLASLRKAGIRMESESASGPGGPTLSIPALQLICCVWTLADDSTFVFTIFLIYTSENNIRYFFRVLWRLHDTLASICVLNSHTR